MESTTAVSSETVDEDDAKLSSFVIKKICRCCLSTERKMKHALDVQEYFMELAGINVTVSDGMPPWVCVECSALMKKGITFKYKMLRAQSVLYDYLMRCAPGQLDPTDPELKRYRAPYLSPTKTLTFDTFQETYGFHTVLQQEKQLNKTDLYDIPLLPMFENPSAALDSVEAAFSDFEDDPLERFENKTQKKHKKKKEDKVEKPIVEDVVDEQDDENEQDDEDEQDDENEQDEDEDDEDLDDEELEDEEEIDEDELADIQSDIEDESEDEEASEPEIKKKKKKKHKEPQSIKMENISCIEKFSQPALDLSWTSENDEILIDFVKKNEALYNPKSKVYKIGVLKKKLWIDIGAILNKSDTECCKRWNYVRDYYIRRRGRRAAGGEAARRRARLLAFLDRVPSAHRAWHPPADPPPPPAGGLPLQADGREQVKEEPAYPNLEHLWEQIRIGDQFMKMNSVAWTSAKEELLIDFVRRNEALYNPRSKDFRKPQVKQKLWCDIGSMLNKSDTECSKRWGYVRDYYTRRKANPGALSTGKAAKRRAQLLAFLDYVPPPQRPLPSLDDELLKSELLDASNKTDSQTYSDYAAHSSEYRMDTYSKQSSNATWTNENDEVLIDFVRRNESLFNPKSKHFRKAQMKQRLWCDIGSILDKSDSDCYKRWCYVRDYYIRRRGKAGILSTGKAAKRRAELLAFLDNVPSLAKSAPLSAQTANQEKSRRVSEPADGAQTTLNDYVEQHLDDFREEYRKMRRDVSWTWENDEKLIEFVRRHDTLYNPKSRNSQLKQKLWREIGKKLNKKDTECCKRWCYVRDYYRRRSKFAPCGESARRRATLLAFLDNVPTVHRSSTST